MPDPYAYFRGEIIPLADAKIGVMTHAFNYGTAVFEGIRGNWNEEEETTFLFRVREHYARLEQSCRILNLPFNEDIDNLIDITIEIAAKSGYREDIYIRPLVYASSEVLGVRLHGLETDVVVFVAPFGPYLDIEQGARCHTSTWRRVDDMGIPPRAKVTGIYVNSALAKTEAQLNGFDEAIVLNTDGHVSEGSGENIFIIRDGVLLTPPPSDNVLEGITAQTVKILAANELGIETIERTIDRTELYIADEVFMTGTAAHVTPVVEVDRRSINGGVPGPITKQLVESYSNVIRGKNKNYEDWCLPVQVKSV
ncbi:MAG: branched-chain amino acid transaminase [Dehalococcoidia bacterium]|nr:branched-chain amino acid transaminase [Dehalococcoidia bacterium]